MDYALTPDGEIDRDRPFRVTCLCCHASLTIDAGDVLQAGVETTCHRCGATVAILGPRGPRPVHGLQAAARARA
jgi:hypothetical protein